MLAIKITTDGGIKPVTLSEDDQCRSIWKELDGYFEIVRIGGNAALLVDDEGILKGKPGNLVADRIANRVGLVGDALLVGLCMTPEGEDFCNVPNWCLNLLICDSFTADDAVNLIGKMVITDKKYPGKFERW